MKIFVSGEALELNTHEYKTIHLARVVGILDLGSNNGDNGYGWSGDKVVVNENNKFYIIDFIQESKLETEDGILIAEGEDIWYPSEKDNLYHFPLSYRNMPTKH